MNPIPISLSKLENFNYSTNSIVFEKEAWGIGKKDIDNGILFLIALKEKKYRIEVGYGLENIITDVIARDILDEIGLPRFKDGKYGLDSYECVQKISEYIISANQ